jgi:hypothetical protein
MKQLWECIAGSNDFCPYAYNSEDDAASDLFDTNGKPKIWASTPLIKKYVPKKVKDRKPQADFGWLSPGTVILSEKAWATLKEFLLQFGELLLLDCEGEARYFYNITNLVPCIDYEKSEKIETAVIKAKFLQAAIPDSAQIFKDPRTASGRMYLTQAAKDILEKAIAEHGLTGLWFFEAGTKF